MRAYTLCVAIFVEAPKPTVRLSAAVAQHLRIVYFGTPLFAVPALRRLHADGWPIEAVVTIPDKPVGRRMTMTPSPVRTAAAELGLPVHTPLSLKDDAFWTEFESLKPDLCIVVAYGMLIPQRYLAVPRLGFLNIHPSLLPAYRGPSPIQSAILDGCSATGVSIMVLDEQMDHGPVLAQESWVIPSGFDTTLCEDELSRLGADILSRTLPLYIDGTITPQPQNHALATTTKKFERPDGRLDWSKPALELNNRIRALSANPGSWTTWADKSLNIIHAHVYDGPVPQAPAGTVIVQSSQILVACGGGALTLESIQLEGSTRQSARDFVNGRPTFIGSLLV
jgi:methionyl-tRNA formyltransferase